MKISTKKILPMILSFALIFCVLTTSALALVAPRASKVFSSVSGSVSSGQYSATAYLVNSGSVTISMTLQKQEGSDWVDKDSSSGTYSSVSVKSLVKSFTITESGKYRCSYTITGTVNGETDTRSDYSSTFTK